jgi:hypothetical protein
MKVFSNTSVSLEWQTFSSVKEKFYSNLVSCPATPGTLEAEASEL